MLIICAIRKTINVPYYSFVYELRLIKTNLNRAAKGIARYIYTNKRIMETTNPATVKIIPLLNAFVLGLNIQKLEITKKNKEIPKKVFNGESVSLDWDL